jgi:SAM-dependent methyltransferase
MIRPAALTDQIARIKHELSVGYIPDEALADVLGAGSRYAYTRPGMGVEFGNLLGRFANFMEKPAPPETPPSSGARLVALTALLCPTLAPGEETTRSIRFKNASGEEYVSKGANPAFVSYHLYDHRGGEVEYNGLRSPFPIALEAGQSITVPVNIRAPDRPGTYRLDICLVQEHLGWHAPIMSIGLMVRADPARIVPPGGQAGNFEYKADFNASVDFIREALAGTPSPDILEVACGLYPVSALLVPEGARVTAVDLCWPELQMASLIHNREGSNIPVRFICADVDELPFDEGRFDAVVICAAVHHFPDPCAALAGLRRLLRPGGRLVVVREPSVVNIHDPGYLADLKRGYNEQQFTFDEYIAMLDGAGYAYQDGQIDFGGSLKLVAAPASPEAPGVFQRLRSSVQTAGKTLFDAAVREALGS